MPRLFRRRSPHLRPTFLRRCWLNLSPAQRRHLKGLQIAINGHMWLIAILYAVVFAAPNAMHPIEIWAEVSEVSRESTEVFTLDSLDVEEPIVQPEMPLLPELEEDSLTEELMVLAEDVASPELNADVDATLASEIGSAETESLIGEIDRRVAAAGGELQGAVRVSLMFAGADDLDLYVQYTIPQRRGRMPIFGGYPNSRFLLSYQQPRTPHGLLDVDANASRLMEAPCENIIFPDKLPPNTQFVIGVHHYRQRSQNAEVPFVVVLKQGKRPERVFKGVVRHGQPLKVVHDFRYR